MSAPRPQVTDPFHPLNPTHYQQQFLYIQHGPLVISCMWFIQVCAYLTIAHALLQKKSFQGSEPLFSSCCVPYGTCWCLRTKQMAFTHSQLLSEKKKCLKAVWEGKANAVQTPMKQSIKAQTKNFLTKQWQFNWIKSPRNGEAQREIILAVKTICVLP